MAAFLSIHRGDFHLFSRPFTRCRVPLRFRQGTLHFGAASTWIPNPHRQEVPNFSILLWGGYAPDTALLVPEYPDNDPLIFGCTLCREATAPPLLFRWG
jgi:hypothetical protein